MNRHKKSKDAHELEVLHYLLHIMVGSYVIGWSILAIYSKNVPLLEDSIWRIASAVVFCLTLWLAITLSIRALIWWSSAAVIVATLRAAAYASEGVASVLGAWMLVLSGIAVTTMAILSVQALTGRLPKEPS